MELESLTAWTQALLVVAQIARDGPDKQPRLRDKPVLHSRRLADLERRLTSATMWSNFHAN